MPNADRLIVEREKIVGYLLNAAHRYGAAKVRFFSEFGFRAENWGQLAQALREHGQRHEVTKVKQTAFRPRYEVDGPLPARMAGGHFCAQSGKRIAASLRHGSSPRVL